MNGGLSEIKQISTSDSSTTSQRPNVPKPETAAQLHHIQLSPKFESACGSEKRLELSLCLQLPSLLLANFKRTPSQSCEKPETQSQKREVGSKYQSSVGEDFGADVCKILE